MLDPKNFEFRDFVSRLSTVSQIIPERRKMSPRKGAQWRSYSMEAGDGANGAVAPTLPPERQGPLR